MNRTRIVRWLRVLLPLAALAILSTLFLFSRQPGGDPNIPYADVDPSELPSGQRMAAPEYSGVTGDGSAVTLRAKAISDGGEDGAGGAEGLRLTWRTKEGLAADLAAPQADMSGSILRLRGGVTMTTSSGWILTAPQFSADTDKSVIEAPAAVAAKAPFGELSADSMTLSRGKSDRDHVLNFTGDVRLLYQP